jgi:hypothetical protein
MKLIVTTRDYENTIVATKDFRHIKLDSEQVLIGVSREVYLTNVDKTVRYPQLRRSKRM